MTDHCDVPHEEIAHRAYEIWQTRGCPDGDGSEDWQAAKAELVAKHNRRNGLAHRTLRSIWNRVRQKVAF